MKIKAHAKVNIFLKITGTRGDYHLLSSRFMKVENLYDTITFKPKSEPDKNFRLIGDFGCPTEKNSIYKAYSLLLKTAQSTTVENFFALHEVVVEKSIPEFAGLGGGSSDAGAFLRLCNEVCRLQLSTETLGEIGAQIGADVPFFTANYSSANVSGTGEIVAPFEEEPLHIETFTPPILCNTAEVYRRFRKSYMMHLKEHSLLAKTLIKMKSADILHNYRAADLNDLFAPACDLYPDLKGYAKEGWFFSGSGSTFFKRGEQDIG